MSITPELKQELAAWLDTYWTTYLRGDLETWATFIKEDYYNIGGTKEEIWHSKEEILDYTHAMAEQMQGNAELRNRTVEASAYGDFVMLNEFTDMYVKAEEEWVFYGHFRMSSLMEKTDTGWIVQHQHGSFPDMKAAEGEAFGLDAIKAENERLKKSVAERTADLVTKNKELEIEAALERVRAVAMGMKNPDDMLQVCRVISDELSHFGIRGIRNVQTALIDEQHGMYLCYQYFTAYSKTILEQTAYLKSPVEHGMVKQMLASENAYFTNQLSGDELKAFREHRKAEGHFPDPLLDEVEELTYCFLSIGQGGLGLTVYGPFGEETLPLFQRFHQVFSLAYSRFRDIEKAEAQTREAQIELALERVRAQSIAMHSSSDVGKCIVTMFAELTALGVDEGTRFGIGILNPNNENNQVWTASKVDDEIKLHIGHLDMTWHPLLKSAREAWKAQTPLHSYVLEGEELLNYYQMLNNAPDYKIKIAIEKLPKKEIQHCFIFEHGFFYAFSPREFRPELIAITQRFTSVFGQTYRRYLDLVKAEGQTREAEISLALERVRARSLSMHLSNELQQVIKVVFDQLAALKIPVEHAGFIIDYREREDMHIWLADQQQGVPSEITIPYFDSPHWNSFREAKASGESFFANLLPFEVKNKFYEDLFQFIPPLPAEAQEVIFSKPALAISTVLLDDVGLYIEKYVDAPFSSEENALLLRVGKVFQQAYTRFLDLQKAESQAREAQIEAAVERIRAQSMAMHHPDDLDKVNKEILSQLNWLQVPGLTGVTFYLIDELGWVQAWDFSSPGNLGGQSSYTLQFDSNRHEMLGFPFKTLLQTDLDYFVADYPLKKLEKAVYEFEEIDPGMAKIVREALATGILTHQWTACCRISKGLMGIDLVSPPSEDTKTIGLKIAGAFNQAYTRFVDLQKAEAQVREAKIEAALEKVRSRSLAMHNSIELKDVAAVLRYEMGLLGVEELETSSIYICNNPLGNAECWYAIKDIRTENGKLLSDHMTINLSETWVGRNMLAFFNSVEKQTSILMQGDQRREWINYCSTKSTLLVGYYGAEIPERTYHLLKFSHGYIGAASPGAISGESWNLLQRVTAVFSFAYTRFLDLQKAEAQAREAQIELALERVRARTMAMQHSDELADASFILDSQVRALGIKTRGCAFNIYGQSDSTEWFSSEMGTLPTYQTPRENVFLHYYEAGQQGESMCIQEFAGEACAAHYDYLCTLPVMGDALKEMIAHGGSFPRRQIDHATFFKYGYLLFITLEPLPDAHDIFKRFAKVFEQTYTRFLDLQKAEAQAREAQIEAALERVRSRSLAMHTSEELAETATVMFQQLQTLGVDTYSSGITLWENNGKEMVNWLCRPDGSMNPPFKLTTAGDPWHKQQYESWKKGEDFIIKDLSGEEMKAHFEYLRTYPLLDDAFTKIVASGHPMPERQIHHAANFSDGNLLFITLQPYPDAHDTFIRFTKVFQQTYTRFLDLQKAEAQAREAQIEAALERVRSRTMAMQSSEELADAAYVLFEQLNILGVTHERINIGIVNEPDQSIDFWVTEQGGKKLNTKFSGRISEPTTLNKAYNAWKKGNKSITIDLKGQDLKDWLRFMAEEIKIPFNKAFLHDRRVQTAGFFSKGMLVVTSPEPLVEEALYLLEKFAGVFDLTYTRFSDLKIAEAHAQQAEHDLIEIKAARQKAEVALNDLKSAQEQLVQQEKLASLGQLTAGIAHEIKNPLNFVNNFSDLSRELIDEVFEELANLEDSDTKEEIIAILQDVKGNLNKVHEHGSRADSIVTSMLQHSRASGSKREPKSFNPLVKEFVNLSFHGMRAGKSPINVDIDLQLDPQVGDVTMISEDFSRVILNLCNNAFDAMRDKLKLEVGSGKLEAYFPKLTVKTALQKDKVILSIADNGGGIPVEIQDKILQPFFTTKKGTEGTGLGLSITHDIVKAHGGELRVETSEGKGSEFRISLPIA